MPTKYDVLFFFIAESPTFQSEIEVNKRIISSLYSIGNRDKEHSKKHNSGNNRKHRLIRVDFFLHRADDREAADRSECKEKLVV